jgi:branched-subunit amino acid aminotransferase/4-amino-4-deoxychorismate lyase
MNRGFLYGDGFFETIRIIDGQTPLLSFHIDRIHDAIEIYGYKPEFTVDEDLIRNVAKSYDLNGILRINFFRDGVGTYLPESNGLAFDHSFKPATHQFYAPISLDLAAELDKAPKHLGSIGIYDKPKPKVDWLTVKSLSSIYYVLAAKKKQELNTDYLLIKNENNELCEEVSSNIILTKGEDIIVPDLDSGGVLGATQRLILSNYSFQLDVKVVSIDELNSFDKIYLTRGTRGVFRIK